MPPTTESPAVIIDCHCHTFNANDLPIYGFLKRVALNADEEILPNLVLPLAGFLSSLTHITPDADQEIRKIARLQSDSDDKGFFEAPFAQPEDDLPDDDSRFVEALNTELQKLEKSDDKAHFDLLRQIKEEIGLPQENDHLEAFPQDLGAALLDGGGAVNRYVKWIRLLTKYRFKITRHLINLYSSGDARVDLFTPALVDYDNWVQDRSKTGLAEQVQLMEANIRLHKGQIHPFFPFDPWRHAFHSGPEKSPLQLLQDAVEHHGFIGAKLYPPMGFSPTGNADHTRYPANIPDPADEFGRKIDLALEQLYALCAAEGIPILTHCADSNEVEHNFGKRADPEYWSLVANRHPSLRINLGHFGDLDTLRHEEGWAWKVGRLLNDPNFNVYADVSHHNSILNEAGCSETMVNLSRLIGRYPNVKDRILFGTDWSMLARIKNHKRFLTCFQQAYQVQFGQPALSQFMGNNAARFLGLHQGDKNRTRLERFYEKHQMERPRWCVAVDAA